MDQHNLTLIENRCTFIGLPSSGKTSFIGAFWHIVESGEIDSAFAVDVPPGDREYLNQLRKNFLDCEAPERTKTDFVKKIEIRLTERSTGKIGTFAFPDLSGETFESQFEYRKMTTDYVNDISECNSLMLFVNPSRIKKSYLISTLNGMLDSEDSKEESSTPMIATPTTRWTPKMCQTQVILVDLIQMIHKNIQAPCKIGVIVSAWDMVKQSLDPLEALLTPDQWLKTNLPLLDQYLTSNKAKFPSKIFGISAQGDEYKENDNSDLQAKIRQSERVIVQYDTTINHDITIPLKWLFD